MCCQKVWTRMIPFTLTVLLGVSSINLFQNGTVQTSSGLQGLKSLNVISKTRARYTEMAKQHQVQGTVTLRVTFLANGEIGSISPINELPDGLTEQAISAAKEIKFEPAALDGQPVSVTKLVQYSFTLY